MSVSGHHKSKEALENRNALLKWYYSIYPLFGYCCVGTEVFYILLFVIHKVNFPHEILASIAFYGCLPACVMKQIVNVAQLLSAAYTIAERDALKRNKE
jgi:CDP-diacylglycerol--inositol 3-phosphatidyltransferase